MRRIGIAELARFAQLMKEEEKSKNTELKYLRDVKAFMDFAGDAEITRELVAAWKKQLEKCYKTRSVNSMLASLNCLLRCLDWEDCRVRNARMQREIFCSEEKELTKAEYLRLLKAARKNKRLNMIIQTMCATGVRVSELRYFTVEAVKNGSVIVYSKGKSRKVISMGSLQKMLLAYIKEKGIEEGIVFRTRNGNPVDRSNTWSDMKKLCAEANVAPSKVFPHNLRRLFARSYYEEKKDIVRLADVLGHASIDTTRIYIQSSGREHRRILERMNLVVEM